MWLIKRYNYYSTHKKYNKVTLRLFKRRMFINLSFNGRKQRIRNFSFYLFPILSLGDVVGRLLIKLSLRREDDMNSFFELMPLHSMKNQ